MNPPFFSEKRGRELVASKRKVRDVVNHLPTQGTNIAQHVRRKGSIKRSFEKLPWQQQKKVGKASSSSSTSWTPNGNMPLPGGHVPCLSRKEQTAPF
uniref:Uncharacterized protein n=1 Tax=Hordeum vulgare subsp. vulgare TaxID=112509 RepID=A0A8I7BAH2_HORVV